MRRPAGACLLLSSTALAAICGCASVPRSEQGTVTSTGVDPRAEIARLEEGIDARRATLGLPARSRVASIGLSADDEDRPKESTRERYVPMAEAEAPAPKRSAPPVAGAGGSLPPRVPVPVVKAPRSAPPAEPPAPPATTPFDGEVNAPSAGAPAYRPPAPAAPRPQAAESSPAEERSTSEGVYRRPPRSDRCRQVVQAADEICDAADRICRLAGDLHERSADDSCRTARLDCSDARDAAQPCL